MKRASILVLAVDLAGAPTIQPEATHAVLRDALHAMITRNVGRTFTVMVRNARGRCLAGGRVSDDVRPAVAVLATGAWFAPIETSNGVHDKAGNPNVLTLNRQNSAFSGGCSAHTCLVTITKYDGDLAPPHTIDVKVRE